jgi:hypothetical protein
MFLARLRFRAWLLLVDGMLLFLRLCMWVDGREWPKPPTPDECDRLFQSLTDPSTVKPKEITPCS